MILLHTCCAPCATASVERLQEEGRKPVLFFSNSNIFPREEYEKRFETVQYFAEQAGVDLYADTYDHGAWLKQVSSVPGFETEPKGGLSCAKCFKYSFRRTASKAAELGISCFTTSLSISPYKKSCQLFEIGSAFAGFLPADFKKRDGYRRSIELSKGCGLYRPNYCGCEFSRKKKP